MASTRLGEKRREEGTVTPRVPVVIDVDLGVSPAEGPSGAKLT